MALQFELICFIFYVEIVTCRMTEHSDGKKFILLSE